MWGTVDAFALEYDSLKESEPVAFMQYDWSRGGDAIAVSEEINSVTDLKGKRIAVAEARGDLQAAKEMKVFARRLERADEALADLAHDRLTGAAVLRVGPP